ncbi:hypothetical protein V5O48_010988 [Marasmius crinis-equi]|uniref:Transmembrane protein n=1 Tax=Marasmius crinis-equi TaxID=585013 RepID=A0ABR3F6W5_9AGAR
MGRAVRTIAIRTLVASVVALTTSLVNIGVLTMLHGKQLGWVCLGSCGADVILNALVLFWVALGGGNSDTTDEEAKTTIEPHPHPFPHSEMIVNVESKKTASVFTTPSAMFPELVSRSGESVMFQVTFPGDAEGGRSRDSRRK